MKINPLGTTKKTHTPPSQNRSYGLEASQSFFGNETFTKMKKTVISLFDPISTQERVFERQWSLNMKDTIIYIEKCQTLSFIYSDIQSNLTPVSFENVLI